MQTWSRGAAVFQTKCQNVKCDLSDFDRGMIVGARQGALNISKTADLLRLSLTQSLEVAENHAKNKKKTSSEQQFCRQKCVVNERGQWRKGQTGDSWEEGDRNVNNHTLQQWYAEEHTMRQTF